MSIGLVEVGLLSGDIPLCYIKRSLVMGGYGGGLYSPLGLALGR